MSYCVRPLACIVPFLVLAGCATQPPPPAATRPPGTGCLAPTPEYPAEARRWRLEGTAVVSGTIEPDGSVSEVHIVETSGYTLLDEAAMKGARSMTCAPPMDPKTGQASRVSFSRGFSFGLDGSPTVTPSHPGLPLATRGYAELVSARVKSNLLADDNLPGDITAVVKVLLGPDGSVLRTTLQKSSGVKSYDDAVLKAIQRSDPLPLLRPGQLGTQTMVLTFRPK